MKLTASLLVVLLPATANAFCASPSFVGNNNPQQRRVISSTDLKAAAIYYGSQTGNTATVAEYIADAAGVPFEEIGDAGAGELEGKDAIIVGAPTWHTGEDDMRSGTSWDDWLYTDLPKMDLKGKKVAIFGCGDQQSYGDYYCDAAGELYDCFKLAGCTVYGLTSTDGYDHISSKAEIEKGKFCGVMFDEDNQYELSVDRAKSWVEQLKTEGFF